MSGRKVELVTADTGGAPAGMVSRSPAIVCGRYAASSVTVAERPRVVRRRRIAVASKATKTRRSRLATFNAEVKTRTIRIRLIRALVRFIFIVQRAVIKIIVAVGQKGLPSERPNGGGC